MVSGDDTDINDTDTSGGSEDDTSVISGNNEFPMSGGLVMMRVVSYFGMACVP